MTTSVSALRAESDKWTLASDGRLLEYLKSAGDRLVDRSQKCEESIRDLSGEALELKVRLETCITTMHVQADQQFIESRVYEDDGGGGEEQEEEKQGQASANDGSGGEQRAADEAGSGTGTKQQKFNEALSFGKAA